MSVHPFDTVPDGMGDNAVHREAQGEARYGIDFYHCNNERVMKAIIS